MHYLKFIISILEKWLKVLEKFWNFNLKLEWPNCHRTPLFLLDRRKYLFIATRTRHCEYCSPSHYYLIHYKQETADLFTFTEEILIEKLHFLSSAAYYHFAHRWYIYLKKHCTRIKFFIKDFFSKGDQIRRKLRIWSHSLKKFLLENFILCAVIKALLLVRNQILSCCNSLFIIYYFHFKPLLHFSSRHIGQL